MSCISSNFQMLNLTPAINAKWFDEMYDNSNMKKNIVHKKPRNCIHVIGIERYKRRCLSTDAASNEYVNSACDGVNERFGKMSSEIKFNTCCVLLLLLLAVMGWQQQLATALWFFATLFPINLYSHPNARI